MRCPESCALALSAFLVGQIVQGAEQPADLVVLNGKIVTVNPHSSIVEAAAVREGRFVAVGANSKVKKLVGDRTRVIDARGKTVVPGLIETHVHAIGVARDEAVQPFVQLSSIAEIQQWVRQQAQSTPKDEWIQIPRIDLTRLREGRLPTRSELDAATAEHPVVFNWQYGSRQIQVLNTAALRAAKITRDTPDPTGGKTKIVKDAQGEPTGVLENPGGLTSKFRQSKPVSDEAFLAALKAVHRAYNRIGITSVIERNSNVEGYRTYEKLKAAGELAVRATVTIGYTLIHAYFPNATAIRRAAELGVCVDTQPAWYYKDGDALAKALGEDRLKHFIGLADWRKGGLKVAINSDHMHGIDPNKSLNPFNPFLAMYVAVTRRTESGRVIGLEQRVSREQALRMATIDAAYLSFDEKRKGSIEVGKLGDLVLLSDDLLTCDAERIKDIQPLATVVGGKVVHDALSR